MLSSVPEEDPLSKETREFVEDMNGFGRLGEALRYPYHTVRAKATAAMDGPVLPDGIIPDIPAVVKLAKQAGYELGGLTEFLMRYEQSLIDSESDY